MADKYTMQGFRKPIQHIVYKNGLMMAECTYEWEAKEIMDALNAAHARGELGPQPSPTLYLRADGKRVADERREDKGRFYRNGSYVMDRATKYYAVELRTKTLIDHVGVSEAAAAFLNTEYDRRNVEQRSGKDRRESGRRVVDAARRKIGYIWDDSCIVAPCGIKHGRRVAEIDRRVTTGTVAERAKGGE